MLSILHPFPFLGQQNKQKQTPLPFLKHCIKPSFQKHRPGWLTSRRTTQQHHSKQWLKLRCHMLIVPIPDPQQTDPNRLSYIFSWLVGHLPFPLHLWGTQAGHNGVRRGRTGGSTGLRRFLLLNQVAPGTQSPLEGTGPASLPVPYRPFLPPSSWF